MAIATNEKSIWKQENYLIFDSKKKAVELLEIKYNPDDLKFVEHQVSNGWGFYKKNYLDEINKLLEREN